MSRAYSIAIGCIVAFETSLSLARTHPLGNAGLYAQTHSTSIMQRTDIPLNVRETLTSKCVDCHSTHARVPLYGRFAPVFWLLENDLVRARKAMNLSQWDSYSVEEREA